MAKQTVVLTGSDELNRKLKRLVGTDAKKAVRKASRAAMKPVAKEARSLAPRNTGALAKSIKVRAAKRSRVRIGARITTDVPYAAAVELGYSPGPGGTKVPARSYLRTAANNKTRDAMAIYSRVISDQITKLAKKK